MENNKLNKLDSKMKALIIKAKTTGSAYVALSVLFAYFAGRRFCEAAKLEAIMETANSMISVFIDPENIEQGDKK